MLVSVVVALAFAPLAVRFRGLTFLTVMLAFGQVVWGVAIRWTSFTGGENGIPGVSRPSLGLLGWDLETTSGFYWFTLLATVVATIMLRRLGNSPVGLSLLGIRESDGRMLALGYDVQKRRVVAFVAAAGAGALYGTLSAFFNKFIGPGSLHWQLSAQILLSVVIGGAGSLWGPFMAGAAIHMVRTTLVGETQRWPMVLGALCSHGGGPARRPVFPPGTSARLAVEGVGCRGAGGRGQLTDRPLALEIESVAVHFGGLTALNNVSFAVESGARHGVLGPNGAGKTTLFNAITGFTRHQRGKISLHGDDISNLPAHRRVRLGIARTFQITNLLPDLTALENVLLGVLVQMGRHKNVWMEARADRLARQNALTNLRDLKLEHLAEVPVGELGYGEQRQLEIATALSLQPRVLLLDEPTAGLSSAETGAVLGLIKGLPPQLTVVIIEHDLEVVFQVADRLTVLHYGEVIANGNAEDVRRDPAVQKAYLGGA